MFQPICIGFQASGNSTPALYSNLVQVAALDLDTGPNGALVFSLPAELNAEPSRGLFRVEAASGWLQVDGARLDRERHAAHALKLRVQDRGANPGASYADVAVRVRDLNDHAPTGRWTAAEGAEIVERQVGSRAIIETLDFDSKTLFNAEMCNCYY